MIAHSLHLTLFDLLSKILSNKPTFEKVSILSFELT